MTIMLCVGSFNRIFYLDPSQQLPRGVDPYRSGGYSRCVKVYRPAVPSHGRRGIAPVLSLTIVPSP